MLPAGGRHHGISLAATDDRSGIRLLGVKNSRRGIVHVIGPERGFTQPGKTIVCGDSHTTTHGAFGALAFGIGTTEVGHVLATQCLTQRKPKTLAVEIDGRLAPGVTAKDVILAVIGHLGVDGGTHHVIEYLGAAIRAMSMEERMTVCNMAIEAGARAGMVAPDDVTFEYLAGRPMAPAGDAWDQALARWRSLPSDPGSRYDRSVRLNAGDIAPQITWGIDPGMVTAVEPGLYYPEEGGVRIEDDVLVTADGFRVLGTPIPKTVEEVEQTMNS